MTRFDGTIEAFADVDVDSLVEWVMVIPIEDWPKMADDAWRGWGEVFVPLAYVLTHQHYPDCSVSGLGMFLLAPGQIHPVHQDVQPDNWVTRVHVPIVTNPHSVACMDDGPHVMQVGKAYRFNTLAMHSVSNGGTTPRLHFIFDIVQ